jgi:16S rRNA (adenine1518-N6/adenine1519-N6)-dimethyltransferase
VAIEVDPYLVHYLRQKFQGALDEGRLELIEGDILKVDLGAISPRPVIAGNLPYYITSPILDRIFSLRGAWEQAVFLMQSEVAARLTASPGTRDFGYLSVLTQVHAHAENLFGVSREAFRPPPKVDSALVRLTPRDAAGELGIGDLAGFLRFAQSCFRQKRKTLRNNLGSVYGLERIEGLPEARMRAEQLSVAELAALYKRVA